MLHIGKGLLIHRKMLRLDVVSCIKKAGFGDLLVEAGGTFKVSTSWIGHLLKPMGLSHRKATTAAQKLPENWEELDTEFAKR